MCDPATFHDYLLFRNQPPTEEQNRLYEEDSGAQGYGTTTPTKEQLEATLCLALASVSKDLTPTPTCYFFAPKAYQEEVLAAFQEVGRRLLSELKGENVDRPYSDFGVGTNTVSSQLTIRDWLARVKIGEAVGTRIQVQWVACGYDKDTAPSWMQDYLL